MQVGKIETRKDDTKAGNEAWLADEYYSTATQPLFAESPRKAKALGDRTAS